MPKLLSDVSSITNCAVCRYQQYEARVNCKTCRTLESKRDFSRDDSEMIYFSPIGNLWRCCAGKGADVSPTRRYADNVGRFAHTYNCIKTAFHDTDILADILAIAKTVRDRRIVSIKV